jgi:hypothetical protein
MKINLRFVQNQYKKKKKDVGCPLKVEGVKWRGFGVLGDTTP